MKVILVNGSPNAFGSTYTALAEVASSLNNNNVETEIFQLGIKPIAGCRACNRCFDLKKCVINDDSVNTFIDKADQYDGYIFGSPVHYAAASGAITSFLDRVFYAAGFKLEFKPAANIVCCRRAGSTAALSQLNEYLTINNMPVASSQYWNMVHGTSAKEVRQDLEGMQTMRTLGNNMTWLLNCLEAGKKAGVNIPEKEERVWTNFIK